MKPQLDTTGNPNLIVLDPVARNKALTMARGHYQRGLLLGQYALSGADLKGKANKYGGHYSRSRGAVLNRCRAAGIPVSETTGSHNKRILVIGEVVA